MNTCSQNNILVIREPGKYTLSEKVYSIRICCNNVELNGEGLTITQENPDNKNVIGITVGKFCKNIRIKNLTLRNISGGGILIDKGATNIYIENVKIKNCGYLGFTNLSKVLPKNLQIFSYGIMLRGQLNSIINNVSITDCDFTEIGIYRGEQTKFEISSSALVSYYSDNVRIERCTVDGCIGFLRSYGLTLISMSNAVIDDLFITDVYSSRNARDLLLVDIDVDIKDYVKGSIQSNINHTTFLKYLDNQEDKISQNTHSRVTQDLEVSHYKGIVPSRQNIQLLIQEHKWREFRGLSRLVCHDSDKKSKTSLLYAKWVERFCEESLGVKVVVETGFANMYLDGTVKLPLHRDQYKKWVVGLSFGSTRTLDFVRDVDNSITSFVLEDGDVIIFSPSVNDEYRHRMLPESEIQGVRVNLTYFVAVLDGEDESKLLSQPKENSIPSLIEL